MISTSKIKQDFPIFKHNPDLVYLDSAATSLKPQSVIDKLVEYYEKYPANIKRGIYKISEKATEEYEQTRKIVADFINADNHAEIIFTRSTTESLNLVAYSLGREIVGKGDEVVTTVMEHHSNFVPWQQLAFENGADFKVIDIDENGELGVRSKGLGEIITKKTKILALSYVSNVLGTINPVKEIAAAAKKINPEIIVIVDAAQAIPHMKVDAKELGADFIAFSGHKMLGPTGVGVLWGKKYLLDEMFPFQFGGEMIREVKIEETTFADPPEKFEAGTPSIADVIALKEAIKYLKNIGIENIEKHENSLVNYLTEILEKEFKEKINVYGPRERAGIVAFNINNIHPHDIAAILDEDNIAVRAGHHCAMPLHKRLKISASCRFSFYIYNNKEDIDKLINSLKKAVNILE